jgi:hypothetical protein
MRLPAQQQLLPKVELKRLKHRMEEETRLV